MGLKVTNTFNIFIFNQHYLKLQRKFQVLFKQSCDSSFNDTDNNQPLKGVYVLGTGSPRKKEVRYYIIIFKVINKKTMPFYGFL